LGTPTNLQWVTACGLVAIAASQAAPALSGINSCLFSVAAGLSGPFSFVLSPIFGARAVMARKEGDWRSLWLLILVLALGTAQAIAIASSPGPLLEVGARRSPFDAAWPAFRLFVLSTASRWAALPMSAILLTGLRYGEGRSRRLLLAGCILILVVSAGVKFAHDPEVFDSGRVGLRYWYIPAVTWFFVAASLMSESRPWLRGLGGALLALLIAAQDWTVIAKPEYGPTDIWSEKVRAAASGPVEYHYPPGWFVVIPKQPP
jgi:hypothetical protein